MGAMLGGTMRSPLTAVVFALELTHDINILLPLLLAGMIAHAFTVLTLRRSILTEKVSRRGYHLSREYSIDPLEIVFAREVARTAIAVLPADATPERIRGETGVATPHVSASRAQRLFPVIDSERRLAGVLTRAALRDWLETPAPNGRPLRDVMRRHPVVAYDDEPLRSVVFRMAETGLTRLPVVTRDGMLAGMLSLADLLTARARILEADRRRERVLGTRFRLPTMFGGRAA